jgi:hypothetical protein
VKPAQVNLISDTLPFGRLWYTQVSHAIGYAKFYSRSHDAVIGVYDDAGLAGLGRVAVAWSQFEHNLSATTMNYCKAKLSCKINAAGATFSGMGTALRVAA